MSVPAATGLKIPVVETRTAGEANNASQPAHQSIEMGAPMKKAWVKVDLHKAIQKGDENENRMSANFHSGFPDEADMKKMPLLREKRTCDRCHTSLDNPTKENLRTAELGGLSKRASKKSSKALMESCIACHKAAEPEYKKQGKKFEAPIERTEDECPKCHETKPDRLKVFPKLSSGHSGIRGVFRSLNAVK